MKQLFYISFCVLLAACGSKETEKKETVTKTDNTVTLTDAQLKNANLQTGNAERKRVSSLLKVNGQIDVPPQNLVSISFPLGGYLKSTKLLPGMQVSKSEPIAVMEDQQYIQLQQDYLSAKAKQTYLEHDYNRQKELNQSKASSDKVFQQSEADYKCNSINVKAFAEKLRLIGIIPESLNENSISRSVNVYAPITGFVSKVNVNIGKYVNPVDVLFEIVNPSDIHLRLAVFEKDINQLSVGQKVVAYAANNPDKKYDCEIILIGKDIAIDRSIDVHCHFKQFDKSLVPGMYMIGTIEVQNKEDWVIPEDAVVRYENKTLVFLVNSQNQFELIPVITGAVENGFVQINLESDYDLNNKSIVIKNAYTLLMKMKNTD
ncbi:MAG: efflux RND transporter periplasmic adaptor subunit [Taibaiella sp.]|nr:efflux RND transporter periplasmic adaptor subunit [Taibaiella sp.]